MIKVNVPLLFLKFITLKGLCYSLEMIAKFNSEKSV